LEYPELEARIVEERTNLIEQLEEMQKAEGERLRDFAQDAMKSSPVLPFDNHLSSKQREYQLMEQRVFGIIDTIEEVKAFQEGCLINADDEAIETQSSH